MTKCNDPNCSKHGTVKTRGRTFVGTVIKSKMQKTVNVEWPRKKFIPKFERYLSTRSRVKAHNPACLQVMEGDIVEIRECRPLSKTKTFVVTKKMGSDVLFKEKQELQKEGAHKTKEEKNEAN
jgi:small subunit ribosomal protein S17